MSQRALLTVAEISKLVTTFLPGEEHRLLSANPAILHSSSLKYIHLKQFFIIGLRGREGRKKFRKTIKQLKDNLQSLQQNYDRNPNELRKLSQPNLYEQLLVLGQNIICANVF